MRSAIEYLGHHARWALPVGGLVGIAIPQLASLARPYLTLAVITTLTLTLARLNWQDLAQAIKRPVLPMAMSIWQLVLTPILVALLTRLVGLPVAVSLALILQSASAPVGSAAAFALFVGINGERVMVLTVLTTILLPLTLTAIVAWVLSDTTIEVDLGSFFLRVTALVAVPFALAALIRKVTGTQRLRRNEALMAGLNVVALVLFAIAIMEGVTAFLLTNPLSAAGLTALSFVMAVLLHGSAYAVFRAFGHDNGLVSALASGNRNMGLMLAITAGSAGPTTAIYFGLAQIPMYCVPLLLGPLVRAGANSADNRLR